MVYYNAATSEVKYYTDEQVAVDEIRRINQIITAKMQMSSSIIQNNYYEYLTNSLEELARQEETYAEAIPSTENQIIGG